MAETLDLRQQAPSKPLAETRLGRVAARYTDISAPFEIVFPDGRSLQVGHGAPTFQVTAHNKQGVRALASLDDGRIAEAYLTGDIDIEGDMLKPFELRNTLSDRHPWTQAWRFIQPFLFGQVHTNKQAISAHYDIDPEFFLYFLDPKTPCYTQGLYASDDETLDVATTRKLQYVYDGLRLKPGDHVLEIGPGWGANFEFLSKRGVKCTGLSISQASIDYLNGRAKELGYDWELIFSDFLEYRTDRKYDGIVIMGVIEHLPDYQKVLNKFASLLKPGGRVFMDAAAANKKFELSSFMVRHIFGGNHSFLVLHDLLEKVANTPLQMKEVFNDSRSYMLTMIQWGKNLDAHREAVVSRFGQYNYRRMRLFFWGSAIEFLNKGCLCYRLLLELPKDVIGHPARV